MNRIVVLLLIAVNFFFIFQGSEAAEIDSVTPRKIQLENSLTEINRIFNARLAEGIEEANARQSDIEGMAPEEFCDEEQLYTELRKALFQSFMASWGLKGFELDKQLRELLADRSYALALNDSIYRDIDYLEGFSLKLKELSDVVNINGHLVGLDKLGHMFSEGWHYFAMTSDDNQSLLQAMAWGKEQETGKYGYATTGIFSFADLVANFHGWRFWNSVLGKNDDPLSGFFANLVASPYVSCNIQLVASIRYRKIVRAWESDKPFDLSGYLDGMWDEGNNCNSYADTTIEAKVTSRIRDVDPQYSCPAAPQYCEEARKRYGSYAKYLIHPSCLTVGVK
ncbi:hypothetical protein [Desulfopila aestuarii]|uniref:Uncharacterized protein n=1 Tax=Desulfopila aestuarii DSM 18488 TaxID=1121416 RepID=A0A1M7Y8L5_9BACT|nr:hypothetical protein [Desulfopila aestuarii]SHO48985.1 hypothetical protein SAMN02745220_02586 [Desulfopila aestuarii DSM 18488]